MATDPDCGMAVEPSLAAGRVEHAGETYYFCSRRCLDGFQSKPARYANGAASI